MTLALWLIIAHPVSGVEWSLPKMSLAEAMAKGEVKWLLDGGG